MKERMYVDIEVEKLSPGALSDLLSVCPTGRRLPSDLRFSYGADWNDKAAVAIRTILAQSGMVPWPEFQGRKANEYLLIGIRDYEAAELDQFRFYEAMRRPKTDFSLAVRLPDGRLEIEPRFFKRRIFLEANCSPSLIVSREVRRWIEASGLKGMIFRPVDKEKGRGAADTENLWELATEHVLPPMSPRCTWFDEHGNPGQGDPQKGRILKEGLYRPPEFHYLASSLKGLPDSDFFMTWERFYSSGLMQLPSLVVTRRFYEFCRQHDLEIGRNPVHIDPD